MAVSVDATGHREIPAAGWYARPADTVAEALGVDPSTGLSGGEAASRLATTGPNALPEEKPSPGRTVLALR